MVVKRMECLVCHQMLVYSDDNTGVLIEHLNKAHSNDEVFRYLCLDGRPKARSDHKWDPHQPLVCPNCGKEGKLQLKRKQHFQRPHGKILSTFFWCWPMICFRLCGNQSSTVYACCPFCAHCLGTYDTHTRLFTRIKG